jgi:hypothetical protein
MNTNILETICLHLECQHITELLKPGGKVEFIEEDLLIIIKTYYFGNSDTIRPPNTMYDENINTLSITIHSDNIPQTPMAWLEIKAKMINKKIIITCPIRK